MRMLKLCSYCNGIFLQNLHFLLTERQGSEERNLGTLFWISILVRGSRIISQTLFIFQSDTGKNTFPFSMLWS
jgi:hypothetical protein